MTQYVYILFQVLMSLQPYYQDKESVTDRKVRMEIIAEAIDEAVDAHMCLNDYVSTADDPCTPLWKGNRLELAVMMLNLAWHESALAKHIHEDKCDVKRGECDGGRAKSLWQIQYTPKVKRDLWWSLGGVGYTPTFLSAHTAGNILAGAHNGCRTWEGAVASYATGKGCKWSGAAKRVEQFHRLLARAKVFDAEWQKQQKVKRGNSKEAVPQKG